MHKLKVGSKINVMEEMYSGYVDLIVAVVGCERSEVLSLDEKDVKKIDTLLDSLPDGRGSRCSSAEVISLRFGLRGKQKHTLRIAGELANISPEAIRAKEAVALRRLRHPSRAKYLRRFSIAYLKDKTENEAVLWRRNSVLVEENEELRQAVSQIYALIAPLMPPMIPLSEAKKIFSDIRVDDLELSIRASNCLSKLNIKTLGELVQMREVDLLKVKNFSRKSLNEIKEVLSEKGLSLRH